MALSLLAFKDFGFNFEVFLLILILDHRHKIIIYIISNPLITNIIVKTIISFSKWCMVLPKVDPPYVVVQFATLRLKSWMWGVSGNLNQNVSRIKPLILNCPVYQTFLLGGTSKNHLTVKVSGINAYCVKELLG